MFKLILAFFIAQFINVVLSTLKSVITIKGGKKLAAIANAISYGFNTVVIKVIADVSMSVAIIISVTCNLVGVYLALWITEKIRKDQLWKITATVHSDNFDSLLEELKLNDISYISYETAVAKYKVLDIFSKHRLESRVIKRLFEKYNAKYTILANEGTL